MLKCGRGQVLRFRWVQSGQANSLPLISFGQCLYNNTPFNKIKFGARGIVFFDVIFLVVAVLFVLMGFMFIYIYFFFFFFASQGPAV